MCLDINPDSVIHKHLVKKIDDLDKWIVPHEYHMHNSITMYKQKQFEFEGKLHKEERADWVTTKHDLTMLPSFHISLGAPLKHSKSKQVELCALLALEMLIGTISLADIHISKSNNKKSAWISVDKFILRMLDKECETQICYNFDCEYDEELYHATGKIPNWHISLANLTGNPHDSSARPEDCIIDTITA
jgi:hypothetical protein